MKKKTITAYYSIAIKKNKLFHLFPFYPTLPLPHVLIQPEFNCYLNGTLPVPRNVIIGIGVGILLIGLFATLVISHFMDTSCLDLVLGVVIEKKLKNF